MENVLLCSKRILLRSLEEGDVDAVFAYRSLEGVAKYQYWEPFTKEQTVGFIGKNKGASLGKRGEWIGFAIVDKVDGKLIGDCCLRMGEYAAEIGCNVSPEYQQRGFAKEALCILVEYAFQQTGIEEVFGITDSENKASIELMGSLGMVKSADFEERLMCKGVLSIEHKYLIKRADLHLNPGDTGRNLRPNSL